MVYAMMSIGVLGFIVWAWNCDGLLTAVKLHETTLLYAGTGLSFQSLGRIGSDLIGKSERLPNQQEIASASSSETNTQSSFNFALFIENLPKGAKKPNQRFLEWFVGFTEGDGSFGINSCNDQISLRINQKDPKVLYYIRKELGFGYVRNYGTYFCYSITKLEHIRLMIFLFSGNLVLKKTAVRFERLVEAYCKPSRPRHALSLPEVHSSKPCLKTAWFSGFIDAKGYFDASWVGPSKTSLRLRFSLTQCYEPDAMLAITMLSRSLYKNGTAQWGTVTTKKSVQLFTITTQVTLPTLQAYLHMFPLRSIKMIAFQKWEKLFNLVKLKSTNYEKLERLRRSINEFSKD